MTGLARSPGGGGLVLLVLHSVAVSVTVAIVIDRALFSTSSTSAPSSTSADPEAAEAAGRTLCSIMG